jgi:hypothetical protein
MHLVQLFVPVGSEEAAQSEQIITDVQRELTARYGGATAYVNSPANGLWSKGGQAEQDRVVVIEVMVDAVDKSWWQKYREQLQKLLSQKELLIRVLPMEKL